MRRKSDKSMQVELTVFESMLDTSEPLSEIRLPIEVLKRVYDFSKRINYDKGYNSGWVKANRYQPDNKLAIKADQLEAIAKELRQVAQNPVEGE